MKIKQPKLGDMVRIVYRDNFTERRRDYAQVFSQEPFCIVSYGRFIGSVNGYWFVESEHMLQQTLDTMTTHGVMENSIEDVKILGHDDLPLSQDLVQALDSAKRSEVKR